MATMPNAAPRPVNSGFRTGTATIGRGMTIKGEIFSKEDLTIDGDVEGKIEVLEHALTVGPNGVVKTGVIKTRELVVIGTVQGNVEARDRVEIRNEGKVIGDIKTSRIAIDDGAYCKGGIDIVRQQQQPAAAGKKEGAVPA